jgi:hypothetical protein
VVRKDWGSNYSRNGQIKSSRRFRDTDNDITLDYRISRISALILGIACYRPLLTYVP